MTGRFEPAWLTHAIAVGFSPRRGMATGMTADGAQRNVFPNLWNDAEVAGCRPAGRMDAAPVAIARGSGGVLVGVSVRRQDGTTRRKARASLGFTHFKCSLSL